MHVVHLSRYQRSFAATQPPRQPCKQGADPRTERRGDPSIMPHFVKSIVLSAVLLASVAASAYAQSASVAALPSANQGRPPAAAPPIGPTADEVAFPDGPRDIWNNMAKM